MSHHRREQKHSHGSTIWVVNYRKPKRHRHHRRRFKRFRWKRLPVFAKVLVIALVLYSSMTLIAAMKFQEPYDSIRRMAVMSGVQTRFEARSTLDHIKLMIQRPRFAWKCLWISDDDMYMAVFLAFDTDANASGLNDYSAMY